MEDRMVEPFEAESINILSGKGGPKSSMKYGLDLEARRRDRGATPGGMRGMALSTSYRTRVRLYEDGDWACSPCGFELCCRVSDTAAA